MTKNDFTRKRKQSFSGTLIFMLNRITKTLSVEIHSFINHFRVIQGSSNVEEFTKSAFVQYRKKIKSEVFIDLSRILINEFYTDNEGSIELWNGLRLLAVDGSRVTLPVTQELQEEFGVAKNQTDTVVVQGRVSVLYDVLNGFIIDSKLSKLSISERKLALDHLEYTKAEDLVIYDRGYPSFELIHEHKERGIEFLFRVQSNFNNQVKTFIKSDKQTDLVYVKPDKTAKIINKRYSKKEQILVRLDKVILPNGSIEILMSSLTDIDKYLNSIFKELYFFRWKVETFYDELKNKLKIENFSGYSKQAIYQDFYSTIFVCNIQSLLIKDINENLKEKQTKYQYKVNANVSYGILKDKILEIFLSEKPMGQITKEIKDLFKKHTIPIRPDRKNPRLLSVLRYKRKPLVTKNQKDAI